MAAPIRTDEATRPGPVRQIGGARTAAWRLLAGAGVGAVSHSLVYFMTYSRVPAAFGRAWGLLGAPWLQANVEWVDTVDYSVALVEVVLAVAAGVALAVRASGRVVAVAGVLGWVFLVQSLLYLVPTLRWFVPLVRHDDSVGVAMVSSIVVVQLVLVWWAFGVVWARHQGNA